MQDLFLDGEGILICQNADGPLAAIDSLKDFVKKRDSNSNSKGKTSSSKVKHKWIDCTRQLSVKHTTPTLKSVCTFGLAREDGDLL